MAKHSRLASSIIFNVRKRRPQHKASCIKSNAQQRQQFRKSAVHYWRISRTLLTLHAFARIATHCGFSLASLLQGELADWHLPPTPRQLALQLNHSSSNQHQPKR